MGDYQFKQQQTKIARQKGRYPTCITNKTKLNKTKPTKVIYTSVNSKLVDIVRIKKAQGTETTATQSRYNTIAVVAMLY